MLVMGIVTFLAILTVMVLLYQSRRPPEQEKMFRRLSGYAEDKSPASQSETAENNTDWRGLLTRLGGYVGDGPLVRGLHMKMQQAGIPLKGSEFLVLSSGLSVIAALVAFILTGGSLNPSLMAGVLAYLGFSLHVKRKITQRVKSLNNQLGDALALMANALRSGLSFLQAVEVISREMPPPIAEEFSRLLNEMLLGITTEQGLSNLTSRVPSRDLDLVVTSVLIQRQAGGNLAEIFDKISQTIRDRQHMQSEILTLTAQGRLSGWIVGLMPVSLLVILYIMNPDHVMILYSDPLGQLFLGGGLILQLVGAWVISRIVSIDG